MIRKWLLTLSLGSALALLAPPLASSTAQAEEHHGHYVVRHYDHHRYHYNYVLRVIIETAPVYVTPAPIYVQPVPAVIQAPVRFSSSRRNSGAGSRSGFR